MFKLVQQFTTHGFRELRNLRANFCHLLVNADILNYRTFIQKNIIYEYDIPPLLISLYMHVKILCAYNHIYIMFCLGNTCSFQICPCVTRLRTIYIYPEGSFGSHYLNWPLYLSCKGLNEIWFYSNQFYQQKYICMYIILVGIVLFQD